MDDLIGPYVQIVLGVIEGKFDGPFSIDRTRDRVYMRFFAALRILLD